MTTATIDELCINCEDKLSEPNSNLCADCLLREDQHYEQKESEEVLQEVRDNQEDYDGIDPVCLCGESDCLKCQFVPEILKDDIDSEIPF